MALIDIENTVIISDLILPKGCAGEKCQKRGMDAVRCKLQIDLLPGIPTVALRFLPCQDPTRSSELTKGHSNGQYQIRLPETPSNGLNGKLGLSPRATRRGVR